MIRQQAAQIEALTRQVRKLSDKVQSNGIAATAARDSAKQASAQARTLAKNAGPDLKVKWKGAPELSSRDGRFKMKMRGRIYADLAFVNDKLNNENTSATEFRTGRLGIEGVVWQDVKYKFEVALNSDETVVKDAYFEYKGWKPVGITVGQFKHPTSLEEQTSSRYTTFMERAAFTDAFGFSRRIGVGVSAHGKSWTINTGFFGQGQGHKAQKEGWLVGGRATYMASLGGKDRFVHLGGSAFYRKNDGGDDIIRYRQRPLAHLAKNRYVNTENFNADSDTFFGLELAGVMGPFSAQSEWGWIKASRVGGGMDPTFSGGYVDVSWFITGEHRGYKHGAFSRPKVKNPVFEGGMGAFQIAARLDYIDLSDKDIMGGKQTSYIFGANWHLNNHVRFMANYSHAVIRDAFAPGINDEFTGDNSVDAVMFRGQVDW